MVLLKKCKTVELDTGSYPEGNDAAENGLDVGGVSHCQTSYTVVWRNSLA